MESRFCFRRDLRAVNEDERPLWIDAMENLQTVRLSLNGSCI